MDHRHLRHNQDDAKWELIQIRITPELKKDIMMWCRAKGLSISCYLRFVCAKTIDNERTMTDQEQLRPIDNAVKDVNKYLPSQNFYQKKS